MLDLLDLLISRRNPSVEGSLKLERGLAALPLVGERQPCSTYLLFFPLMISISQMKANQRPLETQAGLFDLQIPASGLMTCCCWRSRGRGGSTGQQCPSQASALCRVALGGVALGDGDGV